MRNTLLLCSFVLLASGIAGAQTNASPAVHLTATPTRERPAQTLPAQSKPAQTTPPSPPKTTNPGITNALAGRVERPAEFQPGWQFLGERLELTSSQPKANELTLGRWTVSGVVVQAIKAKQPLQFLNPVGQGKFGSGWDNIEDFEASIDGRSVKLFSINF